ncbi:hypothetical protein [Actinobacillus equuli]|uniref:hypothetical protein n=1 Tax=Actinobacillus equuli TaxID=718 RepID=UPI0024431F0D|nr:hypothetical protein [Actinobacillus equuli]WGE42561.1 hypothetical protein NYR64_01575 [Actinobacillus equuli subsp. haemolyticus]
MKHAKIRNKFIVFILMLTISFYAFSSVKKDYEINNNNVELFIDDSGDFTIFNRTKSKVLFFKDNILSDGVYSLDKIVKENDLFVVKLIFGGSGGQEQNYYYYVNDNSASLVKESVRFLEVESDFLRDKICEYVYSNKSNECFYVVYKKDYLYDDNFRKTNMYLIQGDKVKIINDKLDNKGRKWYFINYKGKKDINMWIKAEAVDIEEK